MPDVDIWSKGEVASFLVALAKKGQVKECKFLRLERGHANAYYPRCEKNWASRVPAHNVVTDITAYSAPSSYSWPSCPSDCPHYQNTENFLVSVARDQYDDESPETSVENPTPRLTPEDNSYSALAPRREPDLPEKVTIPWLLKHVPVTLWVAGAGLLIAAFVAGAKMSHVTLVRELLGLNSPPAASTPPSSPIPTDVTKKP